MISLVPLAPLGRGVRGEGRFQLDARQQLPLTPGPSPQGGEGRQSFRLALPVVERQGYLERGSRPAVYLDSSNHPETIRESKPSPI